MPNVKPNPAATTELFEAIRKDDQLTARRAVLAGANLNATTDDEFKDTPLHLAARLGRSAIGRMLMEKGANKEALNAERKQPWEVAKEAGHSISTWAVFKNFQHVHRDNPRDEQTQKLFDAIEKDDLKSLAAALDAGANINYAAQKGRTPLHKAAIRGNAEAVTLLLERGADHKLIDGVGYTAEAVAILQYRNRDGTEAHKECAETLKSWREKHGGPEPKIYVAKKKVDPNGLPGFEHGQGTRDKAVKLQDKNYSWRNSKNLFPKPERSK